MEKLSITFKATINYSESSEHTTPDGNSQQTIKKAKDTLERAINAINCKYTPGTITPYLINTVLPQLVYQLQVASISKTDCNQLDSLLRKVTKQRNNLPSCTPNHILYNADLAINLLSIQDTLDKTLLNNTLLYMRDPLSNSKLQTH